MQYRSFTKRIIYRENICCCRQLKSDLTLTCIHFLMEEMVVQIHV